MFFMLIFVVEKETITKQTITIMRTLFDNYNTNDEIWLKYFKEYCEENGIEMPADAEYSDEFCEWQSEVRDMEWEDLLYNIESAWDSDVPCVVTGTVGRWNGRFEIELKAFHTLKESIYACVSNMDYVILTEDKGVIKIEVIHHDGRNYFEIHKLNKKGLEAYCNDEDLNNKKYYKKFDLNF